MPHKTQSRMCRPNAPTKHQPSKPKALLPHKIKSKPAKSHLQSAQDQTLTAPQQRRGSKNRDVQTRGRIRSSPLTAPGSATEAPKPQEPKPNRGRRTKRGGESSLFSGVKKEERRIRLKKKEERSSVVTLRRRRGAAQLQPTAGAQSAPAARTSSAAMLAREPPRPHAHKDR